MIEPNTDVIQGTLDMLILKTLSLAPLHGYGISRRIEQPVDSLPDLSPEPRHLRLRAQQTSHGG